MCAITDTPGSADRRSSSQSTADMLLSFAARYVSTSCGLPVLVDPTTVHHHILGLCILFVFRYSFAQPDQLGSGILKVAAGNTTGGVFQLWSCNVARKFGHRRF